MGADGVANGMTSFSLITLSYQSAAQIETCLRAMSQQAAEIIHADNGSNDIDLSGLKTHFPAVTQLAFGENLGFAAGMNRAAAMATGDWLGFVNPDAYLDPDWLRAMQVAIEAHPDVKIFTALQRDAENPHILDGAGDALTFFGFPYRSGIGHPTPADMKVAESFAPCGAAFLIRRDLWDLLGGFDERFFCYCEDADLGFRARLMGEVCLFVPQACARHVGSASLGVRSDFALYHGYRNRLWLYVKNMPLALLIVTLPVHIGMTLLGAIKDTLKGKAAIVWRALFDALKGIGPILKSRKMIQSARQITALRLAKSLTWNLKKIATRAIDHRSCT